MTFIIALLWIAAAIWLWRKGSQPGASQWWRLVALAVVMPLAMFAAAYHITKHRQARG